MKQLPLPPSISDGGFRSLMCCGAARGLRVSSSLPDNEWPQILNAVNSAGTGGRYIQPPFIMHSAPAVLSSDRLRRFRLGKSLRARCSILVL